MKIAKRATLVVGLLLVASLIASSLLAISDQTKAREQAVAVAAGGGCGGGCGEGGGCGMAAGPVVPPCPKAAAGEQCDPKTCEQCAKAVEAKAVAAGGCPISGAAAKDPAHAGCPISGAAAKDPAHAGCPMTGKAAPNPAAAAACPTQAKGGDCDPKTCEHCAAAAKTEAAKPADKS